MASILDDDPFWKWQREHQSKEQQPAPTYGEASSYEAYHEFRVASSPSPPKQTPTRKTQRPQFLKSYYDHVVSTSAKQQKPPTFIVDPVKSRPRAEALSAPPPPPPPPPPKKQELVYPVYPSNEISGSSSESDYNHHKASDF